MANVIDIVIRANDQATRQIAETQRSVSGLAGSLQSIASLGPALAIAFGAVALGATSVVKATRELTDQLDDLQRRSSRTGLGVEDLQALDEVLKNSGVSAEAGTQALTFLSRAIATQDPVLKALGITTRDTGTAFAQLLRILSSVEDVGMRNEIAFRLMGRSSADIAAIAGVIVEQLGPMRAELIATGAAITSAQIPALNEIDQKLEAFDRRMRGVSKTIKLFQAEIFNAAIETAKANAIFFGLAPEVADRPKTQPGPQMLSAHGTTYSLTEKMVREINALLEETAKRGAKAKLSIDELARTAFFIEGKGVGDLGLRGTKSRGIGVLPFVKEIQTTDWRGPLNEFSQTTQAVMLAAADAVGYGFQRAFAGIIDGTLNLKGAVVTIVSSMVDSIIAQLARIAAKGFVSFLGNLIAPGLGTILSSGMRAGPVSGAGVPRGPAAARGGNTYIFNGFNVASMYRETVRPGGAVRRANDRLLVGAAY